MRAIRMTCATALLTVATAISPQTAAAASSCADLFPFVCLFGPEAQAMQPSPPVMTEPAPSPTPAPKPRKKRAIAKKAAPMHAEELALVVEAETEPADKATEGKAALGEEAEGTDQRVKLSYFSYGTGPAFAMSVRLAPSMLEQIKPPSSACMIEQSFNDLFGITPPGPDSKLAAATPEPARPMMLVAIKTGSNGLLDTDEAPDVTHSAGTPEADTK